MFRKNNLGTINPTDLDKEATVYLEALLKQNLDITLFSRNKPYSFHLPNTLTPCEVQLTHDVLMRPRKEGRAGLRYEVINPNHILGTGGFGVVLKSEGVLLFNTRKKLDFKMKSRAVKHLLVNEDDPAERAAHIERINAEATHAAMTPHMHSKPLASTFFGARETNPPIHYYMVMKHLPGRDLYAILDDEAAGVLSISIDQRLAFCAAMLRAILLESHQSNLIHLDIKPGNFLWDLATNEVHILDVAACKMIHQPHAKLCIGGTPAYMSPEQFMDEDDENSYTIKSDSYSAGKTIAEFFRAEPSANLDIEDKEDIAAYATLFYYAQFDTTYDFTRFVDHDLSNEQAAALKEMIMELTRAQPENRWSIEQALAVIERIIQERARKTATLTR